MAASGIGDSLAAALPNDGPAQAPTLLIRAAKVFDGQQLQNDGAVLIAGSEIVAVGSAGEFVGRADREMDLGDSTVMPGFIELHAHLAFQKVPRDIVLRHGVTTVRDVGGPLLPPSGGRGELRLLTAGPIITVQHGYPISVFGKGYIAQTAQSPEEARQLVTKFVEGGASIIKIALDPGGEPGAPWSMSHEAAVRPPWPMSSLEVVSAIVAEAHRLGKRVTAHVGESQGVALALAAGVDEWAHIPCSEISDELIEKAVRQKVKVVTTLDTMSHCSGNLIAFRRQQGTCGKPYRTAELRLDGFAQILQDMKAVGDLPCLRRALVCALGERTAAIAADNLDARMPLEPVRGHACGAFGK